MWTTAILTWCDHSGYSEHRPALSITYGTNLYFTPLDPWTCVAKENLVMQKVRTIVHLEPKQREQLEKISKNTGAPVAELIRRAVAAYLEERKEKK